MTISNGNHSNFYHISLGLTSPASTTSVATYNGTERILSHLLNSINNHPTYYNTPPTNISANQLYDFGPLVGGANGLSSYNVVDGDITFGTLGKDAVDESERMGGGAGTFVEAHKEYVFDRPDVRIVFITLYSLVFCCCFFGE